MNSVNSDRFDLEQMLKMGNKVDELMGLKDLSQSKFSHKTIEQDGTKK